MSTRAHTGATGIPSPSISARGARRLLLAADPQRDDALASVARGRERHVDDVDLRVTERERDLGDRARAVGDRGAQLVHGAAREAGAQQRVAVGARGVVPALDRGAVGARRARRAPRASRARASSISGTSASRLER